jgi:hypothetical protein
MEYFWQEQIIHLLGMLVKGSRVEECVKITTVRFETWFYGENESFNVEFTQNNILVELMLSLKKKKQICIQQDKPSSQDEYSETDGCTCTYMQPNHSSISFTLTF